jgi:hypothetical protein
MVPSVQVCLFEAPQKWVVLVLWWYSLGIAGLLRPTAVHCSDVGSSALQQLPLRYEVLGTVQQLVFP